MKSIRIALISSIFMLAACQESNSQAASNEPKKEFTYNLMCLTNNDVVLFKDDVYSIFRSQAGSAVGYKKNETDQEYTYITNAICVITPIP